MGVLLIALGVEPWHAARPFGTVVQTVVVGGTVSVLLPPSYAHPDVLGAVRRAGHRPSSALLPPLGVAGYLASHTGAGPAEAAAISFDPPLTFKWSYTVLQAVSGLIGSGPSRAAVGPGTLLVSLFVGPTPVDLLTRALFHSRKVSA